MKLKYISIIAVAGGLSFELFAPPATTTQFNPTRARGKLSAADQQYLQEEQERGAKAQAAIDKANAPQPKTSTSSPSSSTAKPAQKGLSPKEVQLQKYQSILETQDLSSFSTKDLETIREGMLKMGKIDTSGNLNRELNKRIKEVREAKAAQEAKAKAAAAERAQTEAANKPATSDNAPSKTATPDTASKTTTETTPDTATTTSSATTTARATVPVETSTSWIDELVEKIKRFFSGSKSKLTSEQKAEFKKGAEEVNNTVKEVTGQSLSNEEWLSKLALGEDVTTEPAKKGGSNKADVEELMGDVSDINSTKGNTQKLDTQGNKADAGKAQAAKDANASSDFTKSAKGGKTIDTETTVDPDKPLDA